MPQYIPRAFGGSVQNWAIARTQYSVFISGVQYMALAGSMNIQLAVGRRSTAQFNIYTANTTTHFLQYQNVSIFDQTQTLVFSGYITQVQEEKPGFADALIHQIQCTDQHFLADKRVYVGSFIGATPSSIARDVLKTVLAKEGVTEGLILDSGGLAPSTSLAPSITLAPQSAAVTVDVLYNWVQASQVLDDLVTKASAAGIPYYWAIDQYKKLFFVPYTAVVNPLVIDGSWVDQKNNNAKLTRQNPKYRNKQYLWGGTVNVDVPNLVDTFHGDGTAIQFTLTHAVSATALPTVKVNGTSQSLGFKGTKGYQWYFQNNDNTIEQDSGQTVLTVSDTLTFSYIGLQGLLPVQWDQSKIDAQAKLDGTSGIVEVIEKDSSINSLNAANNEISALIKLYGQQAVQLQLNTLVPGYFPGQQVTVNLPWHNLVNQQMLIESVQAQDSDGLNIWYTINCILGPYDTTWVNFWSSVIYPQQQVGSITVNSSGSTQPVSNPGSTVATFTGKYTLSSQFSGTATTVTTGGGGGGTTGGGTGGTGGGTPTGGTYKLKLFKFGDNCNSSSLATASHVAGSNLLLYWADISSSADAYNFGSSSYIEQAIKPWADAGKQVILRVSVAGHTSWRQQNNVSKQGTPQWVFDAGVTKITSPADSSIKPQYWNNTFQTKMKGMIQALANKYDGDPRIAGIQIAVGDGGECKTDSSKYTSKLSTMQAAGYTDALWFTYIKFVIDTYASAFTKTQLIMASDTDVIGSTSGYSQDTTIGYITGYNGRIWIQNDGLVVGQSIRKSLAAAFTKILAVQEQRNPVTAEAKDSCHGGNSASGDTMKQDLDIASGKVTSPNAPASSGIFLVFESDLSNSSFTSTFQQYI